MIGIGCFMPEIVQGDEGEPGSGPWTGVESVLTTKLDATGPFPPNLLTSNKWIVIPISVSLCNDHNKVDQIPNAKAAKSQQLDHANGGFFRIKTMDAKSAQKEAKKQGGEPVISLHAIDDGIERRSIRGCLICLASCCCSAVRTESGARRDVSAAVRAIHR